jgi:hypothetical protein
VIEVIGCFVAPPATIFGFLILREVRRLREAGRLFRLEAEASAAEGYPPPDPPTTDSQVP